MLRELRKLADTDEDNFNVLDTKQLADTFAGTTKVMTTLLGAVAAVSLLVGGIGIMNIMLVSVTERTREIGLRLAIGALEREVLLQFLIEAVVLAALGGLVGIVLATVASLGPGAGDGGALPVQPCGQPAVVCVFSGHRRGVWLLPGATRCAWTHRRLAPRIAGGCDGPRCCGQNAKAAFDRGESGAFDGRAAVVQWMVSEVALLAAPRGPGSV